MTLNEAKVKFLTMNQRKELTQEEQLKLITKLWCADLEKQAASKQAVINQMKELVAN